MLNVIELRFVGESSDYSDMWCIKNEISEYQIVVNF